MPDRYFVMKDAAHRRYVVAGNEYELRRGGGIIATGTPYVGHGEAAPEGQPGAGGSAGGPGPAGERSTTPVDEAADPSWRDTAQWWFRPVPDAAGFYYLIDRRHQAALGGGDGWDGRIYHYRSYEGRQNAQWKLAPPTTVASPPGVVHLVDRKHQRALVAGDQADGNLYHQPPGDRRNAIWSLELASEGTGGPAMYITKQELLGVSYAFDRATRLETPPQLVISRTTVGSEVGPQSFVLAPRYSEKVTETVTFQHSATVGLTLSLSLMAGASQLISKTETKFEAKAEFGFGRTTGSTTERTVTFAWQVPIRSSGKPVQVEGEMRRTRSDVPFEATLRTTYADGSTHEHVEPGTWSNVAYTTGEITYSNAAAGS